jgi:hypothetical protein
MFIEVWFLLFGLAAAEQWVVPFDTSGQAGHLEVSVFDSLGNPLHGAEITVEHVTDGNPGKRSVFSSSTLLKYGIYRVRVECAGFSPETRTVEIADHFRALIVGLIPAQIEGHAVYTLRGRIADPERYQGYRIIRLVPLLSQADSVEASIYEGGFALSGVRPGRYRAVLLGPKGICSLSDVSVGLYPSREIVISGDTGGK